MNSCHDVFVHVSVADKEVFESVIKPGQTSLI